jgi:hypothetical protein
VAGLVYGESSVFHVFLEPPDATTQVTRREDYAWLDAAALKGMAPHLVQALQGGFRVRGVELCVGNGGVTSAVHEEADIDATVGAFDDLISELVGAGALRRM